MLVSILTWLLEILDLATAARSVNRKGKKKQINGRLHVIFSRTRDRLLRHFFLDCL